MLTARREVLGGAGALAFVAGAPQAYARPADAHELADLEARSSGRLGVCAYDTATGRRIGWRQDARFAFCSTFKVLAAGAVLAKVDRGEEDLHRVIPYGPADLLEYAPVTRSHVAAGGLTLDALCAAAVEVSDNTAANLIIRALGGLAPLNAFARRLGDRMTRFDRIEPALNDVAPGDPRDTTTPASMVGNLRALLVDDTLSASSRRTLTDWMVSATTGAALLRARLPHGWRAGDKTGRGARGATNDIAILWPLDGKPVLAAVYYAGAEALSPSAREAVVAEAGAIIARAFRTSES